MSSTAIEQKRRDFRTAVDTGAVLDLALWAATGYTPGAAIPATELGAPLLQRDASRAYNLHMTDLSASGMGLRLHSSKVGATASRMFAGRSFLVRITLDDGDRTLALLVLAKTRRVEVVDHGAHLAMEFTAQGRYSRNTGRINLFPLRGRGVDKLASWVGRSTTTPRQDEPLNIPPAWYEDIA